MYGCTEQKYWNAPGVVKVNENLSPVSSLFDLKSFVLEATVCVVPGNGRAGLHSDALRNEGVLVDFTSVSAACVDAAGKANAAERTATASTVAIRTLTCECCHDPHVPPQPASGLSMIASRCCPRLKVTSVTPRRERSLSSGTFIGPGEGAVPGAGCGNAVDRAV
jgi:hypothetical protein